MSDSEAAGISALIVRQETGGLRTSAGDIAALLHDLSSYPCDWQLSNQFMRSDTRPESSYSYDWSQLWEKRCDGQGNPDALHFNAGGTGNFQYSTWRGAGGIAADIWISDIVPAGSNCVLDGDFDYSGTVTATGENKTFQVTVAIDLQSVVLERNTRQFIGGNATVALFYKDENNGDRNTGGTLQFHTDGSATITFGNYTHSF